MRRGPRPESTTQHRITLNPADSVRLVRRRPELFTAFRGLSLFTHCTDDELAAIDATADEVHLPSGRVIFKQGQIGREFVVIIAGTAEVNRDGHVVATLGPGDHLGELSLLSDHPRNATVTATSDIIAEVIDRRNFEALLSASPNLTLNLLRATATRLSELDDDFTELRTQLADD